MNKKGRTIQGPTDYILKHGYGMYVHKDMRNSSHIKSIIKRLHAFRLICKKQRFIIKVIEILKRIQGPGREKSMQFRKKQKDSE